VLCADHGAWDIPEALAEQGFPARRIDTDAFQAGLNAALRSSFKLPSGPFRISPEAQSLYLDEGVVAGANVDRGALLDAAVVWLKARPEVAEAYRADELASVNPAASGSPRDTSLKVLLRRSFVTSRSGDVLVTFKPFIMLGDSPKDWPAGHGSPYAYDRRVPLIFWGPWKGGERREPVRTVDLAPTLAQELGIKPGTVDGKPLNLGPRK
jgi:arylsulfatase A-like enzyme